MNDSQVYTKAIVKDDPSCPGQFLEFDFPIPSLFFPGVQEVETEEPYAIGTEVNGHENRPVTISEASEVLQVSERSALYRGCDHSLDIGYESLYNIHVVSVSVYCQKGSFSIASQLLLRIAIEIGDYDIGEDTCLNEMMGGPVGGQYLTVDSHIQVFFQMWRIPDDGDILRENFRDTVIVADPLYGA